jgi:hypothetical protein
MAGFCEHGDEPSGSLTGHSRSSEFVLVTSRNVMYDKIRLLKRICIYLTRRGYRLQQLIQTARHTDVSE